MKRHRWLITCLAAATAASFVGSQARAGTSLPRSAPEAQGVSSAAILDFVNDADQSIESMHSVMVLRHGKVVAEGWWSPYAADLRHTMFSVTKSFSSTAIGIAAAEGKLSLDDEVLKYFPEDAPEKPSDNLPAMRIRDLLRMGTGHVTEPAMGLRSPTDKPWTKIFLEHPVTYKPGTHFMYNTPASYMLSAIIQKATGQTTQDFLEPRLFGPLGITDIKWDKSPQGITIGGYGLHVHTEDLAKFGQLYLQKGKWEGKQLIPESYVKAATTLQIANGSDPKSDWDQGYCFQFWRSTHNAYRADGAFGQYCVVLPEHDAVIVITSGVRSMQAVLNVVWDKLLPAFKADALPPSPESSTILQERLAKLVLPTVQPGKTSGAMARVAGKTYKFPANDRKVESIKLEEGPAGSTTLVLRTNGKDQPIACGNGKWIGGRITAYPFDDSASAASGAWISDDTYRVKIHFQETPFSVRYDLTYHDDLLTYEVESHVAFGPTALPKLVGKVE